MSLQRRAWVARGFALAARIGAALQAWPQRMLPPPIRLLQVGSAFWQSRVLAVAASLDVATVLGDETLSADALAARVGAQPDALQRLLRMLVAMEIFAEPSPGVFGNNKVSQALRTDRPDNVRALVLMHNSPQMSRPWFEHLEQGVRTGTPPFRLAFGRDLYDYADTDPAFDALFSRAMDRVEALSGASFATEFDWRAFDRLIDLGGSKGAKSLTILDRHAHLQALVVDRAQTIAQAQAYWRERAAAGTAPASLARLQFMAGDLLAAVPAAVSAKDAYLLSAVLHGMDDSTAVQALRTASAAAAPQGATVVVLEMIMPSPQADLATAAFDMQMFMATTGRERTRDEWARLYAQAGLRWVETVALAGFGAMMVLKAR